MLTGLIAGSAVLGALTALLVAAALAQRRRRQRHRAEAARRAAVVELCLALSAELRAGRDLPTALALAASTVPVLAGVLQSALAAASRGGDPVSHFRAAAQCEGAAGLGRIAACWSVAAGTGAGLAGALDQVAEGLRAELAIRREVAAQLASSRASAGMLAVLPAFALLLGGGIGARPWHVLLHTPLGLACLSGGLLLSVLGLVWTERIARAAEDAL